MCTVSFIPKPGGFRLAINRDELRTRVTALPPAVVEIDGRRAAFPSEPSGGTWISVNDSGVCLALINWHAINRTPDGVQSSRGQVVRSLAAARSAKEVVAGLQELPLRAMPPFRLIAVVPDDKCVREWRWDLMHPELVVHPWKARHWFSSGFNEAGASRKRQRVCTGAWRRDGAGSLRWLRDLHRSHEPQVGPSSICMHRADAETVSYTEVILSGARARLRYVAGPPCSGEVAGNVVLDRRGATATARTR